MHPSKNSLSTFMRKNKDKDIRCKHIRIADEPFLIAPRGNLVTMFNKYGHRIPLPDFIESIESLPEKTQDRTDIKELMDTLKKQAVVEEV